MHYEGAVVIEPKKGYYDCPIATLDFASLYPSIMMAHNLCYTTLLRQDQLKGLAPEDYLQTPSKDFFIKSHVRRGLLPRILDDLLAARSQAKRDLANELDPFKKAVYDGRQLALKVTANSVYGFTGAARQGQLPCLAISASVTAFGREMINHTRDVVMQRYTIANGYSHDADVIYGDTDSVMVKFGLSDLAETMDLARDAARFISEAFIKPIKLEFEKVYFPYLLISKKRYAGLFWTKPGDFDKIDCKGIESVRRDNCRLVKELIEDSLQYILIKRNVKGAIEHIKDAVRDLRQNKIDLSLLVISKTISKDSYKVKQAHTELANRLRKRDPSTAPGVGDRVPYVIVRGTTGAPAYERAEDPLYVLEHNVPVDTTYYLDQQLKKPLSRLFKAILKDPNSLFVGDHTRSISISSSRTVGIGSFAVRGESCIGCRVSLEDGQKTLCEPCRPKAAFYFSKRLEVLRQHERDFQSLWTQCQACQGSMHEKVICENSDCPIFYRRTRAAIDLREATEMLDRFSIEW